MRTGAEPDGRARAQPSSGAPLGELDESPTRVSVVSPASASLTSVTKDAAARRAALKASMLGPGGIRRVDRYTVLRVLGEGGMGVVFSAYSGFKS